MVGTAECHREGSRSGRRIRDGETFSDEHETKPGETFFKDKTRRDHFIIRFNMQGLETILLKSRDFVFKLNICLFH